MLENTFIQHSFLAIVLGFIIGIQREMRNYTAGTKDFGGSRTFAIICLIGYLSAFLSGFSAFFLMAAFLSVSAMLIAANVASCINEKQRGTTTEFSAFAAFLLREKLDDYCRQQLQFGPCMRCQPWLAGYAELVGKRRTDVADRRHGVHGKSRNSQAAHCRQASRCRQVADVAR